MDGAENAGAVAKAAGKAVEAKAKEAGEVHVEKVGVAVKNQGRRVKI